MTKQDSIRVDFSHRTDYRIGAMTYQVAAFFDDTESTLTGKIQRLLKNDVQKGNRTVAANKGDDYN